MIPEYVDIETLADEVDRNLVVIGPETDFTYPTLEPDLIKVLGGMGDSSEGSVGIVVLDSTPEVRADLRDIAQEVLNSTTLDTVIVRAPDAGAVVSNEHSRASLEVAQQELLATTDFVAGTQAFADSLTNSAFGDINWAVISALIAIVIIVVLAVTLIFGLKSTFRP